MLSDEERSIVGRVLRPLQIIIAALMFGLGTFTAVVVLQKGEPPKESANLALMAVAMTVSCVVAAILVPRFIEAQQRKAIVEGKLPALPGMPVGSADSREAGALLTNYQVRRVITGALLEGPGFFNAVAYQIERAPYSLGIIVALLFGLATLIPTRGRLEQWLEDELRTVRELRQLRG